MKILITIIFLLLTSCDIPVSVGDPNVDVDACPPGWVCFESWQEFEDTCFEVYLETGDTMNGNKND